jgi:hypothetical protein
VGTTKIVTPGRDGKLRVTYSFVYLDGKVIGRTKLKSVMISKPRTQILNVGTKRIVTQGNAPAQVASAPVPSPSSAQGIARSMLTARGWGSDQFDCLVTLWNHESGWRVHAANPSGAYGIPQALPGSGLAEQRRDADQVGPGLHLRPLRHTVRRVVPVAGQRRLVLGR